MAHFLISLLTGVGTALLVFKIWYEWPFYALLGGREILLLVICVDVVCGPLLTLVVWNPSKSARELFLDMSLIVFFQVGALVYGVYTVAAARPVYIVFETERLRVISAYEIDKSKLNEAPEDLKSLPWNGPKLISTRDPVDSKEMLKSVELSLAGIEPSLRPDWWQKYQLKLPQILERSKSVDLLFKTYPEKSQILESAINKSGFASSDLTWLPLTSAKNSDWIVFIDKKEGLPRAYAPIDGFF